VDANHLHRFRNFGEEVWSVFESEYEVTLEEIDSCTDTFHIKNIKARALKRTLSKIEDLVEKHYLKGIVSLKEMSRQ